MGESPAADIAILLRRRQEGEIAKTPLPSPWVNPAPEDMLCPPGLLICRVCHVVLNIQPANWPARRSDG